MSKLTEFYAMKSHLFTEGQGDEAKWNEFEDKLIREELLPELMTLLKPVLSQVNTPLSINISYDPNANLAITATRNCIQVAIPIASANTATEEVSDTPYVVSEPTVEECSQAEEESNSVEIPESTEPLRKKKKSVGFIVKFKDGTVIHERKAVRTWIAALKKIGLDNIINNQRKHEAWHNVDGKNICIVDRVETVRSSDNASPQSFIDGYYVMTQLSNTQKVKDLEALGRFMPHLGIKVLWDEDDDNQKEESTPTVVKDEPLDTSVRGRFKLWMEQHLDRSTVSNYMKKLDVDIKDFVRAEIDSEFDTIFNYSNAEDVQLYIDMLKSSDTFIQENIRMHNSMTAALGKYIKFVRNENATTDE